MDKEDQYDVNGAPRGSNDGCIGFMLKPALAFAILVIVWIFV